MVRLPERRLRGHRPGHVRHRGMGSFEGGFVLWAICVLGAVPYGTEAVLALLERHPGRWPTSLSDRNDVPSRLSVAPLVIAFALFVMAAVFLPHDDPSAIVREFARLPAKLSPT